MTKAVSTAPVGTAPVSTAPVSTAPVFTRLGAILGGSAGNLVEWFDWFAYASFSVYFASVFFPKGDQTTQFLQSAAVFSLGNAALLFVRIRAEETALGAPYAAAFSGRNRFVPGGHHG